MNKWAGRSPKQSPRFAAATPCMPVPSVRRVLSTVAGLEVEDGVANGGLVCKIVEERRCDGFQLSVEFLVELSLVLDL